MLTKKPAISLASAVTAAAVIAAVGVASANSSPTPSPHAATLSSSDSPADMGLLGLTVRHGKATATQIGPDGSPRALAATDTPSASPSPSSSASGPPVITSPLNPSECVARFGGSLCLGGTQLRHAYGLDRLPAQGAGATVAIVLPYINPHDQSNLDVYSDAFGLPRTTIEEINWQGKAKIADPADPNQSIDVEEGALDMEMVHALAPKAHLIRVAVSDDLLTDASAAVAWLATHRRVDVFEASYGEAELDFPAMAGRPGDYSGLEKLRTGFRAAAARGVTLIASDGDTGPTQPTLSGEALYEEPTVPWPASDPAFTSVSGTRLQVDDSGNRTAPDVVWSEHDGNGVATGGGLSAAFPRPPYQTGAAKVVGKARGVGDVSMNGDVLSRVWIYSEEYQALPGQAPGWVRVAGTSVAAPLLAGLVADAAGLAHHRLGNINPALYALYRRPAAAGLQDVVSGCNSLTVLEGYCARPGYDLPGGGFTVRNAARFVPALAAAAIAR